MKAIKFDQKNYWIIFLFIFLLLQGINYAQNNIEQVLEDLIIYDVKEYKGDIWAVTYGNGVYHYSKSTDKWKSYSTKNNKLSHDFFYCVEVNERYVWAGSSDGLFIYDKKRERWRKRKFGKGGQLSNWIRSIKYDKHLNAVWIGRFKYLTKLDIKKRRFTDYDLTIDNNDKTNTIKTIEVDGDSLVWFGTEAGLHKFKKTRRFTEPGAVTFYDNSKNYFNEEGETVSISSLLFEQNNIWLGLDEFVSSQKRDYNVGGLYRFDRKIEWLRFDSYDGFSGNGIFDLALTGNYIWASLYQFSRGSKQQFGRGIALVNRNNLNTTMIKEGLFPSTVHALHFDGENMWLGTNDGLWKIDLTNKLVEIN